MELGNNEGFQNIIEARDVILNVSRHTLHTLHTVSI